jgi:thiamine biosynthesis lipoprotein
MKHNKTRIGHGVAVYILSALLCAAMLTACASGAETAEDAASYDATDFAMGTVVSQTIYSENKNIAPDIISLLTEIEEQCISWRVEDSEIAAINRGAGKGAPAIVSDETAGYIRSALEVAAGSGGAFDPTIGKLSRLWDFDNDKNSIPDRKEIAALVENVGYAAVRLDGNTVTVDTDVSIDLGAVGKGIACDEIERYLSAKSDVRGMLINIGGSSVLTYGEKDAREPWKVAVLDPRDEGGFLGALSLDGTNHVSTSGDYERFFETGGIRYHHILDPQTGYPADSGLMSVTVVAGNGAYCDALSTACFVLGYERAQGLLQKYGAEAIFVDTGKNVSVTEGLKSKFQLMAAGYTVV